MWRIDAIEGNKIKFHIDNHASLKSFLGEETIRGWVKEVYDKILGIDFELDVQPWEPWPIHTRDDIPICGDIHQVFEWTEESPCCKTK